MSNGFTKIGEVNAQFLDKSRGEKIDDEWLEKKSKWENDESSLFICYKTSLT